MPLEPFDYPDTDPGPQTLLTGQPPQANLDKLYWLMARFGGYIGLINNTGARFTASSGDFGPVMEELGTRGLGYLDDGTSNRSVAPSSAQANKVPFGRADVMLDANPARAPILAALDGLAAKAVANGHAIGVISALPVSIATVAEWAQTLARPQRATRARQRADEIGACRWLPNPSAFSVEHLPYRDCAGVALFNAAAKVFIGRRKAGDESENEAENSGARPGRCRRAASTRARSPLDAARRELFEETSVTSIELIAEAPDWIIYDLPDDLLGIALKGKYRGQRQRWFAFLFTGKDSEIDVVGAGRRQVPRRVRRLALGGAWQEHPDLIVDFKRDAYREIVAAFADIPAKLRRG